MFLNTCSVLLIMVLALGDKSSLQKFVNGDDYVENKYIKIVCGTAVRVVSEVLHGALTSLAKLSHAGQLATAVPTNNHLTGERERVWIFTPPIGQ